MARCIAGLAAALCILVILTTANLFTGQANAQVSGATLSGTITDPSGSVIAGAQLSILNKATGVSRTVATDAAGLYSAPNLQPGNYEVTITATGFSTIQEENITLTVGGEQTLNVAMKIGQTAQTVQVEGAAPTVQLSSSTISSEIESKQVLEMPLNGRSWTDLATLSPGVNAIETQMPFENGAVRGNRGFGAQLTISGGRPTQNNYRLDGLSINDYGNGGPGSVLGVSLGVDAIQEFSVVTGNYSAEYGRTSGGIVNATSKAGTNAFHGDVYEFLRNAALDANDYFSDAAGLRKPVFRQNQFGAAAGGPIIKDKTFVFADYEGIRLAEGVTISNNVPSANARLGNLANGTHINVSPAITSYLKLYPLPNLPQNPNSDKGQFVFSGAKVASENFGTIRGDHKISDKDSLFVTYMYDGTPFTQPDAFDDVNILDQTTRHVAAIEETHLFSPTLVNTARLGYNRNAVINYQIASAINPASKDPSLGVFLGGNNPQTRIQGGFTNLTPGVNGGFTHFDWNSYQFYDDAFWTHATHSLKFGFAMENMRYNFFQDYNPYGILTFHTLTDFLNNNAALLEGGLASRDIPRGLRQTLFGGYIQDDWKMRKNLTLNLGLRYEMTTVLSEVDGLLTNLRNITDPLPYCGTSNPAVTNIVTPATPNGGPGCTGTAPYYSNPTTHNFEPRIGFAYDPKGDGKTAIRGGFALFDILPLPGYFFTQQGIEMPFFLDAIVSNKVTPIQIGVSPSNPASAYQHLGPGNLLGAYFQSNPGRNYIEQWNLNVQHQLTSTISAQLGYIGSHGVHMMMRGDDYDMALPTLTPAGYLWPFNPTGQDLRLNTHFGGIRGMTYQSGSSYQALLATVNKKFSRGFLVSGSYTYSRALDSSSATIAGDAFSNSITTWYWFAPKISYAPSDFNVTHSAVVNATWQLPTAQSLNAPARALVGGWQVGGIFKANSGVPTTPLIAGDPLGIQNGASDPFSIPSRVAGCDPVNHNFKSNPGGVFLGYINYNCFTLPTAPGSFASQCSGFPKVASPAPAGRVYCANLLGNAGRNSIVGPSLVNFDFSLIRNFAITKISEAFNVQFRSEFFNLLNHPNFAPPLPFFGAANAQIFNQDGSSTHSGGLQSLTTQPREIQLALKLVW